MKKLLLLILLGVGFYFNDDILRFLNTKQMPISPVKDLGSVLGTHVFRFTQDLGAKTPDLLPENLNDLVNSASPVRSKESAHLEKDTQTSTIPVETVVQVIQGEKTLTEILQEIPKEELDKIKRDFCADVVQEALEAQE